MKLIKFSPWLAGILLILLLVLAFLFLFKAVARAETTYYLITEKIPPTIISTPRITFFTKTITLNYIGGDVWYSSTPDGTGNTLVDDVYRLDFIRPNGTSTFMSKDYSNGCRELTSIPPQNIKNALGIGENKITITLSDRCGTGVSSTPLYLTFEHQPTPTPTPTSTPNPTPLPTPTPVVTPFLRLPWDYESKKISFNEAASTSIYSYLDHAYPLLSAGLDLEEPEEHRSDTVSFRNINSDKVGYSKHDGYDYAHITNIKHNDTVVAASSGWATYRYSEKYSGNAILIDHQNGYQTRYYHLEPTELITDDLNQKVWVEKGQKIGLVGSTGNSSGPHLHFMVIQDKNKDGNFDDNIPDGITDPYGWQSKDPDPWENYTFKLNDKEYTGNKSYYLWDKPLSNLDATLTTNGGAFKTERYELNFPQNFTQQNLQLEVKAEPRVETLDSLRSIGSTISTTLKDSAGNFVSQFGEYYDLIIDYRNQRDGDMLTIDPTTLKIYSSTDGVTWIEEPTFFDFVNFKASAKLNHMTHFALMGKRIDMLPPTTEAILEGEKGEDNWYRSHVKVTLTAEDNENGLGVEYTFYKIHGQDWKLYESPLEFSEEGSYQIEFYSVDNDQNLELPRFVEFKIDKTSPEAKIYANQETLDMSIEGVDQNNPTVEITQPNNNNLQDIIIKDSAGNITTLLAKFNNKDKKDDLTIYQITYNNLNPFIQPSNKFMLLFNPLKERIKTEKQYLELGMTKINLQYNFDNGITKITTDQNGIATAQQVEGFKLLQVETMSGTLKYSY